MDGGVNRQSQQFGEFSFTTLERCKLECEHFAGCKGINWRAFGIASFNCLPVLEWAEWGSAIPSDADVQGNDDWDCHVLVREGTNCGSATAFEDDDAGGNGNGNSNGNYAAAVAAADGDDYDYDGGEASTNGHDQGSASSSSDSSIDYDGEPGTCIGTDSRCGHNDLQQWDELSFARQHELCVPKRGRNADCTWVVGESPAAVAAGTTAATATTATTAAVADPTIGGVLGAVRTGGVLAIRPGETVTISGQHVSWAEANMVAFTLEASLSNFESLGELCDGQDVPCVWEQDRPSSKAADWEGWLNYVEWIGDHVPKEEGRTVEGGSWYYDWNLPEFDRADYQARYFDPRQERSVAIPDVFLHSRDVTLRVRVDAIAMYQGNSKMVNTCFQDKNVDGKCTNGQDVTRLYSAHFQIKRPPAVAGVLSLDGIRGRGNANSDASSPLQFDPGDVVEVEATRVQWRECTGIALVLEASTANFDQTADCAVTPNACTWDQDISGLRGSEWEGWLNVAETTGPHQYQTKPFQWNADVGPSGFYYDWKIPRWSAKDYTAAFLRAETWQSLPYSLAAPTVQLRIRFDAVVLGADNSVLRQTCFADSNQDGACTDADVTSMLSRIFTLNAPPPTTRPPALDIDEVATEIVRIDTFLDELFAEPSSGAGGDKVPEGASAAQGDAASGGASGMTVAQYNAKLGTDCSAERVDQCVVRSFSDLIEAAGNSPSNMLEAHKEAETQGADLNTVPQMIERVGANGAAAFMRSMASTSDSSAAIDVKTASLHFSLLKWKEQTFQLAHTHLNLLHSVEKV